MAQLYSNSLRAQAARSEEAAEQGHADAQYSLGICFALGKGVEKDETNAALLYVQGPEPAGPCS
jgi:TPR repeat protein